MIDKYHILGPYIPSSKVWKWKRSLFDGRRFYITRNANNTWYCSWLDYEKDTFATADEAKKALDAWLIKNGYILCETEEQLQQYLLLL